MNKEKYLKNFGKAQVDNKKKDKKCWYKDCGYQSLFVFYKECKYKT